uniref:KANSL3 helical domain-containing protein n=1 Tax=Anopheles melas TaxID=34690 RepID=A0A182TRK2_9DIPT
MDKKEQIEAKVRIEKEQSKTFITRDNIDKAIELALVQPTSFGWTVQQFKLFDRVARLLDMDRLARLTNTEKQHEPVHRRTVIDKSVSRLRQALASVSWETRLTQWLHVLLMENLPPSYLAIYIDMLQTLHAKLPLLVDKMIFGSTLNIGQELLGPVLKKPWEPISRRNRNAA